MTQPYYVEPEYWLEGYAEGDATSAAAVMPIQSAVLASAVRTATVISRDGVEISRAFSLDYRPARTQHIRRRRCAAFMNMLKTSLEAPEAEVVN
jgi:hypothetical protein